MGIMGTERAEQVGEENERYCKSKECREVPCPMGSWVFIEVTWSLSIESWLLIPLRELIGW